MVRLTLVLAAAAVAAAVAAGKTHPQHHDQPSKHDQHDEHDQHGHHDHADHDKKTVQHHSEHHTHHVHHATKAANTTEAKLNSTDQAEPEPSIINKDDHDKKTAQHHSDHHTHHAHHAAKATNAMEAKLNSTEQAEPEPFLIATNWVDATLMHAPLAQMDKAVMQPSAILFIATTNCTHCDEVRPLFAKVAERHYDKSVRFYVVDGSPTEIGEAFHVGGTKWGELNDTDVHPLPAIKYFNGGRDTEQTAVMTHSWDLPTEAVDEAVQNIETFVHESHLRAVERLAELKGERSETNAAGADAEVPDLGAAGEGAGAAESSGGEAGSSTSMLSSNPVGKMGLTIEKATSGKAPGLTIEKEKRL